MGREDKQCVHGECRCGLAIQHHCNRGAHVSQLINEWRRT